MAPLNGPAGAPAPRLRNRRQRPVRRLFSDHAGFIANPVATTIFLGLVLVILVYSALELTGTMNRLGRYGPILPLLIIVWLMYGIYRGLKLLKRRSARIRIKGPLFMRTLMNDCLERTCGVLETRLNTPEISSSMILNQTKRTSECRLARLSLPTRSSSGQAANSVPPPCV